jgi:hypothetical protein
MCRREAEVQASVLFHSLKPFIGKHGHNLKEFLIWHEDGPYGADL